MKKRDYMDNMDNKEEHISREAEGEEGKAGEGWEEGEGGEGCEGAEEGAAQAEGKGAPSGAMIEEAPGEEIRRLKEELESKTREAAGNYDRFLRALADLENYKKRVEKEKADLVNFSNEKLIIEILPVVDNLERALEHAVGEADNLDSLKKGVRLTIDGAYAVFVKYGLKEIKAVGERFDPALHHAISHEETADAEPGTVVREFQKGYTLKGRLIRPSMVAVAKRPGEKA